MDFRTKTLLEYVDRNQLGLEVGPSYNPVAPKSGGWRVETVDYLDAPALREKYKAWGVDVSKVEDVDYVISGGLGDAIPDRAGKYGWIIASHVIEHTPDFVRFLQDCETLLVDGGVLSLAVPDKRYCFDVFQPHTSTGMVLQAYWEKRTRHSASLVFDGHANHTTNDAGLAWSDAAPSNYALVHTLAEAKAITDGFRADNGYIDVHAWRFTPSGMRLVLQDLREMGHTSLGVITSTQTYGFEFFCTLKKGYKPEPTPRLELLRATLSECNQARP